MKNTNGGVLLSVKLQADLRKVLHIMSARIYDFKYVIFEVIIQP